MTLQIQEPFYGVVWRRKSRYIWTIRKKPAILPDKSSLDTLVY